MEGLRQKTRLEQLESRARGIRKRRMDPHVSKEEKDRAKVRLDEVEQEISELRNPPEKGGSSYSFVKSPSL